MKRLVAPVVALVALFGLGGSAFAAATLNPTTTPGATDGAATQEVVCAAGYAPLGNVSSSTKHGVFTAYQVKKKARSKYVIDHLVPVSLGGTNDAVQLVAPAPHPSVEEGLSRGRRPVLGL